jgi:3-oxoacyl-[acyl-carrier protein] reductase
MKYGRVILFGASNGIGLAVAEYLLDKCQDLISVSRRPAPYGRWIKTDITDNNEIESLTQQIKELPIDTLLYLGGTWEKGAFTDKYNFEKSTDFDTENVISVNLQAPIKIVQRLLPNLRKSNNAKIIIIGAAIGGLTIQKSKEVANTASKFGLRGVVYSLRQLLSKDKIGITLINPGNIATPEVLNDLEQDETKAIPFSDLFSIIECVMTLSNRTNINEIELPNM